MLAWIQQELHCLKHTFVMNLIHLKVTIDFVDQKTWRGCTCGKLFGDHPNSHRVLFKSIMEGLQEVYQSRKETRNASRRDTPGTQD